jgi:hypothetical protein
MSIVSKSVAGVLLLGALACAAEPAFTPSGGEFRFDTGALRGTLRGGGQSIGLVPVTDASTTAAVARFKGLLSPYRLLTADRRFGDGAWDWASTAALQPDGSVRVEWKADAGHPLDMTGVYRWASSNALDLAIAVRPREELKTFEVFVASYFEGFPSASAWAGGAGGFIEAARADAAWHMFPRDDDAATLIRDGRWTLPPHSVEWAIRPAYAGALAVRRDAKTGLAALVMSPTSDCFAVAMPYGEESHRSLYVSLLGRDLAAGESATARVRLVVGHRISDGEAVKMYVDYRRASGESP